jgi:hypothetical protein
LAFSAAGRPTAIIAALSLDVAARPKHMFAGVHGAAVGAGEGVGGDTEGVGDASADGVGVSET